MHDGTVDCVCIELETEWVNFGADNCSKLSNIYACAQWFAYFDDGKKLSKLQIYSFLWKFCSLMICVSVPCVSIFFTFVSLGHEKLMYVFFGLETSNICLENTQYDIMSKCEMQSNPLASNI